MKQKLSKKLAIVMKGETKSHERKETALKNAMKKKKSY